MDSKIDVCCKDEKAYTPLGVSNLIRQAEVENNGKLEAVLNNKHKYKNLIEMYHGSFLALSLYKKFGPEFKFSICPPEIDPPDLFFIQGESNAAFPVEIMELYKFGDKFKDYEDLVTHIWKKKGNIKYDKCYLLLASRLSVNKFNVTKFVQKINKFNWEFQRIYLSFYTASKKQWTFYEVFPLTKFDNLGCMYFNPDKDKKYWY